MFNNIIENGSTLQVGGSIFTYNYAMQGGMFNMESANVEVNDSTFYGNNASIGTFIAACGSNSNASLDFDAYLNTFVHRNCTLYDLQRETIVQA